MSLLTCQRFMRTARYRRLRRTNSWPNVVRLEALEDRITPTQRLLPLGDSNTQGGFFQHASYRYPLWEQLQQAGYSSLNFVGTRNFVENEQPGNPNPTVYPNYYTTFD